MSTFHRFCSRFPTFLVALFCLIALTGCTTTSTQQIWGKAGQTATPIQNPDVQSVFTPTTSVPSAVKVAILLPLSGSKLSVGQSMLQAAQLAVFDAGYDNFELMPFDTLGTANGASTAANAAISNGAQIILGPLFAEEVRAAKSATLGKNIQILAFSTDWTLAGGNTLIMGFLPFGQIERIASFAIKRGLKNTAILSDNDSYGMTAATSFENSAKLKGLVTTRTNATLPSNDSVFIPAGGQTLNMLLTKISNQSIQKLGTGLWDDPRLATNPAMNGAWFAAPASNLRLKFESKYQSTYGTTPPRVASLAYDATALSISLAKLGLSRGTGPAFDASSLKNPSGFLGIDGIMRFNQNGMAERGLSIMEIRNGRIVEIDPAPTRF